MKEVNEENIKALVQSYGYKITKNPEYPICLINSTEGDLVDDFGPDSDYMSYWKKNHKRKNLFGHYYVELDSFRFTSLEEFEKNALIATQEYVKEADAEREKHVRESTEEGAKFWGFESVQECIDCLLPDGKVQPWLFIFFGLAEEDGEYYMRASFQSGSRDAFGLLQKHYYQKFGKMYPED